jgi:aspartate oxidase
VTSHPTEHFLEFVAEHGQTFAEAAAARQEASGAHCEVETPHYAQSIAAEARAHRAA